jgi:hypothetical protein
MGNLRNCPILLRKNLTDKGLDTNCPLPRTNSLDLTVPERWCHFECFFLEAAAERKKCIEKRVSEILQQRNKTSLYLA